MVKREYPYIIFLPKESKQRILKAIFGSLVPIRILKSYINQGLNEKIYQKDLIKNLSSSNKTILKYLKNLTEVGIMEENMEKTFISGRVVWLKSYTLTTLGRWFALLLVEEEKLSEDQKIEIICSNLRSYSRWIRELSEKIKLDKEILIKIFNEEIK
jgi:hypothetical protein